MAKSSDTPPTNFSSDQRYMDIALTLARRGLGNVWPNPAVGCVIVKNDRVIGRGWTQPGGRPHAETEALARAGESAKGATAYVTLEPCSHHGETPPCAEALVAAGISEVVIAVQDPDPRVSGTGVKLLQKAGIGVRLGVRESEAADLNTGFFTRLRLGRPMITLKLATSLDGRIATAGRDSKWITGDTSRAAAHLMRAQHDAVLIGSGTALADDPMLTCRLPGAHGSRDLRIVLDGRGRVKAESQIVQTAKEAPTWIVTKEGADTSTLNEFKQLGVDIIEAPTNDDGGIDLIWTVQFLGKKGLTRLMIEGGGNVAASFLRAGLVDRLAWFRAPKLIGGDGIPALEFLGIDKIKTAPAFVQESVSTLSPDILETYRIAG